MNEYYAFLTYSGVQRIFEDSYSENISKVISKMLGITKIKLMVNFTSRRTKPKH